MEGEDGNESKRVCDSDDGAGRAEGHCEHGIGMGWEVMWTDG